MNFIKEKIKDFYLLDASVENIFINEYMPAAPGDYVKVFLYAGMYAEYGLEMSTEKMAETAWSFGEAGSGCMEVLGRNRRSEEALL